MRLLLRDGDAKFCRSFDDLVRSERVDVVLTPVQAPKANAHAERRVRTVGAECLDWLLLVASTKQVVYKTADFHKPWNLGVTPDSPPFPITRGQGLTVLPFGNMVVTLTVSGAELKLMLENGVSQVPAVAGRFPQVSGPCLTYDIAAHAGSRATGAVRQAADGSCTGPAVDLGAGSSYSIAEHDFLVTGGDGSPIFPSRATTRSVCEPERRGEPGSGSSGGRAAPVTRGDTRSSPRQSV